MSAQVDDTVLELGGYAFEAINKLSREVRELRGELEEKQERIESLSQELAIARIHLDSRVGRG